MFTNLSAVQINRLVQRLSEAPLGPQRQHGRGRRTAQAAAG